MKYRIEGLCQADTFSIDDETQNCLVFQSGPNPRSLIRLTQKADGTLCLQGDWAQLLVQARGSNEILVWADATMPTMRETLTRECLTLWGAGVQECVATGKDLGKKVWEKQHVILAEQVEALKKGILKPDAYYAGLPDDLLLEAYTNGLLAAKPYSAGLPDNLS